MITTDMTRMRSTHVAMPLAGPALSCSGVATYVTQAPKQFGDRTPTPGTPRGATG